MATTSCVKGLELFYQKYCCNPFSIDGHNCNRGLRSVTEWMIKKVPVMQNTYKICDKCRKDVVRLPDYEHVSETDQCTDNNSEISTPEKKLQDNENLKALNESLLSIGESPMLKTKISQKKYPGQKVKKIGSALKKKIFNVKSSESSSSVVEDSTQEMLQQFKDKFGSCVKRNEKIQILTVLPRSWSVRKIQREFGAPNYMVHSAKKLVQEKGIMATPNIIPGKSLPTSVVEMVREFYEADSVSRK